METELPNNVKSFILRTFDQVQPYKEGFKLCCPFHSEVTPSLFIYYWDKKAHWFYKCHGCGDSGTIRSFLYKTKGPFETVHIFFPLPGIKTADVLESVGSNLMDITSTLADDYTYFKYRGIDSIISRFFKFKHSYSPEMAVMPIYMDWEYKGSVSRLIDPQMNYKYYIQPGTPIDKILWGLDLAKEMQQKYKTDIFITEGIIDAACLWSIGLPAVAFCGSPKDSNSKKLLQFKNKIWIPDNDKSKSIETFSELSKKYGGNLFFLPPYYKDVSECFMKGYKNIFSFPYQKNVYESLIG